MRSDLPADLKGRIRDFFVNYGKGARTRSVVTATENADLSAARQTTNGGAHPLIELPRKKGQVESDTTLGQAEKQQQLADLDKKLAGLGQPATTKQ